MAINLNDNLIIQAPKAADERYGPYASEAEALSAIEPIVRYEGLTVGIVTGSSITDYWFKSGTADSDFIVKTSDSYLQINPAIGLACSDESTPLSVGTKIRLRMPYPMIVSMVRMGVNESPVGSSLIVDLEYSNSSIFLKKPEILSNSKVGGSASFIRNLDLLSPQGLELSVIIDQVGSTSPGRGLKVWLLGNRLPDAIVGG